MPKSQSQTAAVIVEELTNRIAALEDALKVFEAAETRKQTLLESPKLILSNGTSNSPEFNSLTNEITVLEAAWRKAIDALSQAVERAAPLIQELFTPIKERNFREAFHGALVYTLGHEASARGHAGRAMGVWPYSELLQASGPAMGNRHDHARLFVVHLKEWLAAQSAVQSDAPKSA